MQSRPRLRCPAFRESAGMRLPDPLYSDLDLAATKAFGLPSTKILGEGARIEIRANAFNLFNKLNLANIDNNITDSNFGRANSALGSRTIEGEFHFKF